MRMKNDNYIVHSNNLHDIFLITFIDIYLRMNLNNRNLIILIPYSKFSRIRYYINDLNDEKKSKIKFKKFIAPLVSLESNIARFINIFIHIFNLFYVWRFIIKARKVFFLDYSYAKTDNLKLKFALNRSNNREVYIVLHNLVFFDHLSSLKIGSKINSINLIVLSDTLKSNLEKITDLKSFVFPFSIPNKEFLEKRQKAINNNKMNFLKIIVAGSVESTRRDYYKIVDILSNSEFDFELVYLGKIVDKDIIDYSKDKILNLKYFKNQLTDLEFSTEMLTANYIFTWISNELYQSKKISGSMYDSIMYGVPLISNKIEFSHDNNLNIVFDNAEKIKEYLYSSLYSNNWKKDANKAIFKSKEFLNKVSSIDFEIFNNN